MIEVGSVVVVQAALQLSVVALVEGAGTAVVVGPVVAGLGFGIAVLGFVGSVPSVVPPGLAVPGEESVRRQ